MSAIEVGVGQQVESLHERVDELLKKLSLVNELLGSIAKRFDDLPTIDEVQDYAKALPTAHDLKEIVEAWRHAVRRRLA